MSDSRTPHTSEKQNTSNVRSSAAEYLTFVAASGQGGVEAVFADDSVWMTQKITAADGKNYNTQHYNLAAIISVGYKVIAQSIKPAAKFHPASRAT